MPEKKFGNCERLPVCNVFEKVMGALAEVRHIVSGEGDMTGFLTGGEKLLAGHCSFYRLRADLQPAEPTE